MGKYSEKEIETLRQKIAGSIYESMNKFLNDAVVDTDIIREEIEMILNPKRVMRADVKYDKEQRKYLIDIYETIELLDINLEYDPSSHTLT